MNEIPPVVQFILARIEQQLLDLTARVNRLEDGSSPTYQRILLALERIEQNQMTEKEALARLQGQFDTLQSQQTENNTTLANFVKSQDLANARLQATIDELRNQAGSGNADAINALADRAETILADQRSAIDTMKAGIVAEDALDEPVPVVSPATATVAPGATQQFSCNVPCSWAADNGSIDASGLYAAPASGSTTDKITATATADGQKGTADVVIA